MSHPVESKRQQRDPADWIPNYFASAIALIFLIIGAVGAMLLH